MTIRDARHLALCGTVLATLLVWPGNMGCVDLFGPDSNVLSSLGLTSSPLTNEGGNVVINCANGTGKSVQWRLAWQLAGSPDPSTLAVTIEPGKTKTLSVEGNVERIAPGSLEGWSVAAVVDPSGSDPHTVTYSGGLLENGVDFQSGDIIRYNISSSADGKYLISAEIARGG